MGNVSVYPTQYQANPPFTYMVGPTLFGSAPTVAAALSDGSDATGVHFGTTFVNNYHQFFLQFTDLWSHVPVGARIDFLQPHFRARHSAARGYIWAYDLRAFSGVAQKWPTEVGGPPFTNPTRYLGLSRSYPTSLDGTVADVACPVTRGADDGTPWDDCWFFTILFGRWVDGVVELPWDASNYPYMTECFIAIGYTLKPTVENIQPTGSIIDPTPQIAWGVGSLEEKSLSAHHIVILPTGSTDASGHAIGDPGFDPTTGSGAGYNSGKVYTGNTTHVVPTILTPATWKLFIRQYIGMSGIFEYASDWTMQTFTLTGATVDQPTLTLSDDTASNTLKVTIAAGTPTADLRSVTIEVQYLDPVLGWVAAPIANSMVNGTGTSVFYDGLHAPDELVSYRARGVGIFENITYASAWTTASHTVANPHQWWLRSSSNYMLNQSLNDANQLLVKNWAPTRQRPNATSWGIGARPATQVHDITKGDSHECQIWAMTHTAYTALRALLEDGDDLILVNPWAEIWRVQPGNEIKEEIVHAAPRFGENTPLGFVRIVNVNFVEVVTP